MVKPCYLGIEEKLMDLDCIIAFETASDYLGICKSTHQRPAYYVYSKQNLGVSEVECTLVESYANIEYKEIRGLKVTTPRQTIVDLITNDRDDQVILESLANWYFSHNESFKGLPEDIITPYTEDAISYYDC